MRNRKAIIRTGNDLRGDDGIGLLIIARLKHESLASSPMLTQSIFLFGNG